MTDIDTNPFGDRDKLYTQSDEPTGETITLTPGGVRGSTQEPEQETSFGEMSLRTEVLKEHVEALYHALTGYLG